MTQLKDLAHATAQLGITHVAEVSGISARRIQDLRRGYASPTGKDLVLLEERLGLPPLGVVENMLLRRQASSAFHRRSQDLTLSQLQLLEGRWPDIFREVVAIMVEGAKGEIAAV